MGYLGISPQKMSPVNMEIISQPAQFII